VKEVEKENDLPGKARGGGKNASQKKLGVPFSSAKIVLSLPILVRPHPSIHAAGGGDTRAGVGEGAGRNGGGVSLREDGVHCSEITLRAKELHYLSCGSGGTQTMAI